MLPRYYASVERRTLKIMLKKLVDMVSESLRALKRVNSLMYSVDRLSVVSAWCGSVLKGVSSLITFSFYGLFMKWLSEGKLGSGKMDEKFLFVVFLLFALYHLAGLILNEFSSWRSSVFDDRVEEHLDRIQIEKITSLDLGRLMDPEFIQLNDSTRRRGLRSIGSLFGLQLRFISSIVGLVASFGVVASLSPTLVILISLPAVPGLIRSLFIDEKRKKLWEENHLARRTRDEYHWCLTSKWGITQTRLFGFTEYMKSCYESYTKRLRKSELNLQFLDFLIGVTLEVFEGLVLIGIMYYLGTGLVDGSIEIAKLFFLFGCVKSFGSSLTGLFSVFSNVRRESQDFSYVEKYLAVTPSMDESMARDLPPGFVPTVIGVNDVSFSYPNQTGKLALNRCSLTIRSGEKVAIVGTNGSGKTTLLRLLAKLFLPNSGSVTIGEQDLVNITQSSWIKHIMCVTPDNSIPDITLIEALTGGPIDRADMVRLDRASSVAGSTKLIKSLPNGYNTQVGEDRPGGVGFSSGQRQKLKLTAALYHLLGSGIHYAFFDEPMSYCDAETKHEFYSTIVGLDERTIVVVSHDPTYLRHFDRVVVMEDGRVIEDLSTPEAIRVYQQNLIEKGDLE